MQKYNSKLKIIFVIGLILFALPQISLAASIISGFSGNLNNGSTITVQGSGLGLKRISSNYDYFDDYTSDWSCNKDYGSCTNPPSSTGIAWAKLVYGSQDPCTGCCLHMQINGNPLYNINTQNPYYSTGRSFVEWPEYDDGVGGGRPNGSLQYSFSSTKEIFFVYHILYDPNWPTTGMHASADNNYYCNDGGEKQTEFWFDASGRKIMGGFVCHGYYEGGKNYIQYEIGGDYAISPTCAECGGYNSYYERSNHIPWNARNKWQEIKIHMKINTFTGGAPNNDGIIQVWVDGTSIIDDSSVTLTDNADDDFHKMFLKGNWSGGTDGSGFTSGHEYYLSIDDFLINYSSTDPCGGKFPCVAAVYVSNQVTWGSGPTDKLNGDSNFIRQKVGGSSSSEYGFKSWSDSQFKFEANLAGLSQGQPMYLYVSNWSGETNSTGFNLTGLPDTTPPAAPSGVTVN